MPDKIHKQFDKNDQLSRELAQDIARWLDRPLVLVGMMGTGKTTVGRRLANCLGLDFVDADAEIEAAAQMSIPEIFEHMGEAGFRDGERRVLARLVDEKKSCVIATGGGAFIQQETRQLILDKALSIWLDADIDTLVERVSRRNTRPLLHGKDPEQVLRELAAKRNPIYAEAHLHVKSCPGPHKNTLERILTALNNRKEHRGH